MKKRKLFYIDRWGIEFKYKGDNVLYLWPWKRTKFNRRFLSISFEATYPTLKALDEEWEGYMRILNACTHGHEDWSDCPDCGH